MKIPALNMSGDLDTACASQETTMAWRRLLTCTARSGWPGRRLPDYVAIRAGRCFRSRRLPFPSCPRLGADPVAGFHLFVFTPDAYRVPRNRYALWQGAVFMASSSRDSGEGAAVLICLPCWVYQTRLRPDKPLKVSSCCEVLPSDLASPVRQEVADHC